MIACKSLLRTHIQAWKCTRTSHNCQKYDFFHGLSCESRMDVRKGRGIDIKRKKQDTVAQTWRKVSTQPDRYMGGKDELLIQEEELHRSTVSEITCEDADPKVVNEPLDPHACPTTEGLDSDMLVDEKLVPSKKHLMSLEIGGSLMRFVRGKGGVTQDEIEKEIGVKIIFPSAKKVDSIIVEGNSAERVTKACERIQSIIDKAVNSRELDYSHFVSLPLAIHPGLVEKLINFQNRILGTDASDTGGDTSDKDVKSQHSSKASKAIVELKAGKADNHVEVNITSDNHSTKAPSGSSELTAKDADTPVEVNKFDIPLVSYQPKESKTPAWQACSPIELGIEKSIFIKPQTFHLTVLMLKLWNKDRVKAAAEVLQSVSSRVMDALCGRPVLIRLKGLECMRGSLSSARVLYAPVEEVGGEGRLLRACQIITDAFVEAGLVIEKDVHQKLKLHATLMNGRHRKSFASYMGVRKNKKWKLDSFDARGIFDLYGSEEWGEYHICEAHLSQRFVFDDNGYYHCCGSIPFPGNVQEDRCSGST